MKITNILAFNNNKVNTLELWFNSEIKGIENIEKYTYKIAGIENKKTFADLSTAIKTVEPNSGSRDMKYGTATFGNTYGIDCWDKLSTTDKLADETMLKKALNSPKFEKIVSLTESPLSNSTSYQDFNMIGLVKYRDGDEYKLGYFKENINQYATIEIITNTKKALTNFNEDKNDCTVTETEFEILPELNIVYSEYLKKYSECEPEQNTAKAANKKLASEIALKAYEGLTVYKGKE